MIHAQPKPTPRIVDRIQRKRDWEAQERACRKAVRLRDQSRCRFPDCRKSSVHAHHLIYRSHGGGWQTRNILSLCVTHHQLVHAGVLRVSGNADATPRWELTELGKRCGQTL